MHLSLFLVPYDSGRRGWRMGAGPEHLLKTGLADHLGRQGHQVEVELVLDDPTQEPAEIRTAFELMRQLAPLVRAARARGRFPLVLSGNCNSAPGTLAGLTPSPRSVFWFDAHGDLNTPETTSTGFLDGTGLATAQGRCWRKLTATIPGFEPVPTDLVQLLGVRDLDPDEAKYIAEAGITLVPGDQIAGRLPGILARRGMSATVGYVHCDLDVLDPSVGQANPFPVPGGLSVDGLVAAIRTIGASVPLGAAAVTAYAPEYDRDGAICQAAFAAISAIVTAASSPGKGQPVHG